MLRECRLACTNFPYETIHLNVYITDYKYYNPFTKTYEYSETFIKAEHVNTVDEKKYIDFRYGYDDTIDVRIYGEQNEYIHNVDLTNDIYRNIKGWTTWMYLEDRQVGTDFFATKVFTNRGLSHKYIIDNVYCDIKETVATIIIPYDVNESYNSVKFKIYSPIYKSEHYSKISTDGYANVKITMGVEIFETDGYDKWITDQTITKTLEYCLRSDAELTIFSTAFDIVSDSAFAYISSDKDSNYDYEMISFY